MKKRYIVLISTLVGAIMGTLINKKVNNKIISKMIKNTDKYKEYYYILNHWIEIKNDDKKVCDWFINRNYHKIAIYGMGELGNRLYEELRDTSVEVVYAIDRNAISIYSDLTMKVPEDEISDVEIIVVTASFAYEEIENKLKSKTNCKIVNIKDVINEI